MARRKSREGRYKMVGWESLNFRGWPRKGLTEKVILQEDRRSTTCLVGSKNSNEASANNEKSRCQGGDWAN